MIPSITFLNHFGESFLDFAMPMFWQSSLLILCIFALDFVVARKVRASVRYTLWLVLLVKLLLPPTLALPTGPAWWLIHAESPVAPIAKHYVVTYDTTPAAPDFALANLPMPAPERPALRGQGWVLLAWGLVSAGLLLWLTIRWWQIRQIVRQAAPSEYLCGELEAAQSVAGWRRQVRLKLITGGLSPSVCGLFRPVILLPRTLVENLSPAQRHAVLVHELFHLRRRDVWINFAQALLQIVYWWHPLLWFANTRIRRLREEAVDDAVMLALRDQAETYAPTLLEVAKLTFHRPRLSLGLVGVMESRSALRQRIERLLDFRAPRKAGLTCASLATIFGFSVVTLPMGEAPNPVHSQDIPETYSLVHGWLRTNLNESVPAGVFVGSNFEAALQAIKRRGGITSLPEPEIVTAKYEGVNWWNPPVLWEWEDGSLGQGKGNADVFSNTESLGFSWYESQFELGKGNGALFSNTNSEALFTRTFNLDTNAFYSFYSKLQIPGWSPTDHFSKSVRSLLGKMGVNWESPKGKSVFYTERLGLLFVRATESDLALTERTLESLDLSPREIHIKSQFFEAPKGTLDDLNKSMLLPATAADGYVGILNSENAKATFLAFQNRQDVKLLAAPEIITISGRQCEIRATENVTIATNFVFQDPWANQNDNSGANAIVPQSGKFEIGPILNVIPYLLTDGYTIYLGLNTSLTEFMGYDTSTNASDAYGKGWHWIGEPVIRPSFRIRKANANLSQWDGQTAVIGGFKQTRWVSGKEKVGPEGFAENELLVFVTATLVDPTDHRIHTDEEIPFAKYWCPPQPPPVQNQK